MNIRELLGPRYEVHIVHNEKESYTKALGNTPSLLTALSCFISALKESGIAEGPIKYAVEHFTFYYIYIKTLQSLQLY